MRHNPETRKYFLNSLLDWALTWQRLKPSAGEIVWMDFDPQKGREQAKRRPALVLTEQSYSRASGLVVVCPLTSKRKHYPFALPVVVDKIEGAVLVDHLKSMDWGLAAQLSIPKLILRC